MSHCGLCGVYINDAYDEWTICDECGDGDDGDPMDRDSAAPGGGSRVAVVFIATSVVLLGHLLGVALDWWDTLFATWWLGLVLLGTTALVAAQAALMDFHSA